MNKIENNSLEKGTNDDNILEEETKTAETPMTKESLEKDIETSRDTISTLRKEFDELIKKFLVFPGDCTKEYDGLVEEYKKNQRELDGLFAENKEVASEIKSLDTISQNYEEISAKLQDLINEIKDAEKKRDDLSSIRDEIYTIRTEIEKGGVLSKDDKQNFDDLVNRHKKNNIELDKFHTYGFGNRERNKNLGKIDDEYKEILEALQKLVRKI